MSYIENPKTKGSGIYCCIPQKGMCPMKCPDCFFQTGRSYLEPLEKNLPNMPSLPLVKDKVVRVNDGNDSNNNQKEVIAKTAHYPHKFYNTSIPKNLQLFPAPVVLTLNPSKMTDKKIQKLKVIPTNLMFLRLRVNTWNIRLIEEAIKYYKNIPIVLTFMRYYGEKIPQEHLEYYDFKKKILNEYFLINDEGMKLFNPYFDKYPQLYTCGREGKHQSFFCKDCGICLREYFKTVERMSNK